MKETDASTAALFTSTLFLCALRAWSGDRTSPARTCSLGAEKCCCGSDHWHNTQKGILASARMLKHKEAQISSTQEHRSGLWYRSTAPRHCLSTTNDAFHVKHTSLTIRKMARLICTHDCCHLQPGSIATAASRLSKIIIEPLSTTWWRRRVHERSTHLQLGDRQCGTHARISSETAWHSSKQL
ncbi:hypothetical protein TRVL_10260 [Trypanosoma vivax]|nr:hypothetical protein TRVL_10260 [Trypanosoma vivax]